MQRRPFGPTGVQVPVIGQGTWQLRDKKAAEGALRLGLELGLTHIDTAELYRGSEEVIAPVLAGRRGDVFLVSKVLPRNATYRGTLQACRQSLDRLGTDHVDAYLLHWWENATPVAECMRAMGELADQGQTRFVGVSNFTPEQIEAAQATLGRKHRLVCDQVFYDLNHRHLEHLLIPYCRKKGIAVVGYSPFGSGAGRLPGPETRQGAALQRVAGRHGATPHQVVLNFLVRDPNVFLIPKAEHVEHVRANAGALDFTLTEEDASEIDAAYPVPAQGTELPII